MNVLVACEESQEVCKAFRALGHDAYSCDMQQCSGGHPEWHIHGDVLDVLDAGDFVTSDGASHYVQAWDLLIAVENPVGFMNTAYKKADQIIHPYMFSSGNNDTENFVTKRTCLWLKNLPALEPTYHGDKPDNVAMYGITPSGKIRCWEDSFSRSATARSKTFPGIARAMAEQWGKCVDNFDIK